jgi:hypothetical protein
MIIIVIKKHKHVKISQLVIIAQKIKVGGIYFLKQFKDFTNVINLGSTCHIK